MPTTQLILCYCLAVVCSNAAEPQDVDRSLLIALREAIELGRHGGDEMWPGYAIESIPIVLFGEDEAYVVQHPAPPSSFQRFDQDVVGLEVLKGPRDPCMSANYAARWNGPVCAFIAIGSLTPGGGGSANVALILHETAHAFQMRGPEGGGPRWRSENSMLVAQYPASRAENNAWGRIEGRLLRAALEAEGDDLWRRTIDFLRVRHHRQSMLQGPWVEYETGAELNEGLAEYFALRAVELGDSMYEPTAQAQELGLDDYGVESETFARFRERLDCLCVGGRGAERQRFYWSGAAQALLLDRLCEDWKPLLEEPGPSLQQSLQRMLQESLRWVPDPEPASEMQRIRTEIGFAEILAEEESAVLAQDHLRRCKLRDLLLGSSNLLIIDLSQVGGVERIESMDPLNIVPVREDLLLHTRMLKLSFDGGFANVWQTVLQDLSHRWLVMPFPEEAAAVAGGGKDTGRTFSTPVSIDGPRLKLSCARAGQAGHERCTVLRPLAAAARSGNADSHEISVPLYQSALEQICKETFPAPLKPRFQRKDLDGNRVQLPDPLGRETLWVFFSAAPWALPSQRLVLDLWEEIESLAKETARPKVVFVASQCRETELGDFLGTKGTRNVVHDADRSLAVLFAVETYPVVVRVGVDSTVLDARTGNTPETLRWTLQQLAGK